MTIALADYEWLTSTAAVPFLSRCAEHTGELTRLVTSLRKDLSTERAHLVIEQAELRRRAKEKFSLADEMFFTRKGLEQATDEVIAAYKAQAVKHFPFPAVDLCCGIGGDFIALSRASLSHGSPAVGVDLDPITAYLARVNHDRLVGVAVDVLGVDATSFDLGPFGLVHIDPDRRVDGARHTRFADLTPGEDFLKQHADRQIAMKLAPATEVPGELGARGTREWMGSRGECRQQVLWLGAMNADFTMGRRVATIVDEFRYPVSLIEEPDWQLESTTTVERYMYEPHAAVLAAKVVPSLAQSCAWFDLTRIQPLRTLTPDGGYLTAAHHHPHPAACTFEVDEVLSLDVRKLKAALRSRGIGRLEIKKRGVEEEPEQLRKKLDLRGDAEATLLLARTPGGALAIIAKRLS